MLETVAYFTRHTVLDTSLQVKSFYSVSQKNPPP